jgi:phosphonate transport system substrate-binding protein
VKSLADIRGKPFGFGDQASTSSHLAPRAYLVKKVGLEGDRDYRVVHLGAHDAVARAVQAGQVPAGALSEAIYRSLVTRKVIDPAKIVQLDLSDPIPNYPMVMQGDLSPGLKQGIRAAFLEVSDKEVLKSFRVDGFVATSDKAYDVLRDMATVLHLDIAKLK